MLSRNSADSAMHDVGAGQVGSGGWAWVWSLHVPDQDWALSPSAFSSVFGSSTPMLL